MNKIEQTQKEIDVLIAKKERLQTEKDDWEWINENRKELFVKYKAQEIEHIRVHKKAVVSAGNEWEEWVNLNADGIWLEDDNRLAEYSVQIRISDLLRRKGEAGLALRACTFTISRALSPE